MTITRRTEQNLLDLANVIGVGYGFRPEGVYGVMVNVTEKKPLEELDVNDVVPREVDGLPTDVIPIGVVQAYENTGHHRPAMGGDSIGHHAITAGTLGCLVKRENVPVILSNNHVLANSNEASVGDLILQPGSHDGGTFDDVIATLEDWVVINFDGFDLSNCPVGNGLARALNAVAGAFNRSTRLVAVRPVDGENLVDAAIALPLDSADVTVGVRGVTDQVNGTQSAVLGQRLVKSGRTTDVTTGVVTQVGTTIQVQYGAGKIAVMRDQVLSDIYSQPGDSGSAILDADSHALTGLLFAGSDTVTVFNRIEHVFGALNLTA